jgi:tetratricopeptide (TPR) repeat protein
VVARIVPVVTEQRFVNGAQALGWYSYNTGQFRTAREWFRKALSWKADDEPSAYGLALSSQRLSDRATFNAIVAQWRSRSQRITDLADGVNRTRTVPAAELPSDRASSELVLRQAIDVPRVAYERVIERTVPEVETRISSTTEIRSRSPGPRNCTMTRNPGSLSGDAALTLGWCLMELNRPLEAVAAFDQAIRAGSDRTREEAAYGKTLAYLRKNLTSQAAVAAAEAPQTSQRTTELSATILAQRALAAYRDGRYVETLLMLNERARMVPEQNDLMLIKGWSYLKLGRYKDAEQIFRAVQRTGFSEEASVGLNAVVEATHPSRQ